MVSTYRHGVFVDSVATSETGLDINGAVSVRVVLAFLAVGMRVCRVVALSMAVRVRVTVAAMVVAVVLMQEGGAQNIEGEADATHNQDQFGVLHAYVFQSTNVLQEVRSRDIEALR